MVTTIPHCIHNIFDFHVHVYSIGSLPVFFSFLLISFAITSHCFQLLPTERVRGPTQWSCIRTQASRIVFGQNKLILYELMHLNVQQLI